MSREPLRIRANLRRVQVGSGGYAEIEFATELSPDLLRLASRLGASFSILMVADDPAVEAAEPEPQRS